ncbi:MAG: cation:proton antiporter [Burkholderiales bacterium]|nr:cation:proton antiporter [Burkholderiales bacterium]
MSWPAFLPEPSLSGNTLLLFGLLLLAGYGGGELARRVLRAPRIVGYVLVGIVLGAGGLNVLDQALVRDSWIFVEIGLALVLFELGRRLDLAWLKNDRWLLATGLFESAAAFGCVYFALARFGVEPIYAALAAAIGVSTSPAVVLLVAQELRSEGQVTERALNLTALNSIVAFVLTTVLTSWVHHEHRAGWLLAVLQPVYSLAGSLVLAYAGGWTALWLARWIGKHAERQLVILLAVVVLAIGVARMFGVSVLLTLLALGMFVRNFDERHDLVPVDLAAIGQVFFVVLFVVSGAKLTPASLVTGGTLAAVFVLARFTGKSLGVMGLTYFTGARRGSAGLLCLALTPMSGVALALVHGTETLYPEFGAQLAAIVAAAVLVLELAGPFAVQFALRRAGEAREP